MLRQMTTNHDCGPTAVFNAMEMVYSDKFKLSYEEFLKLWKFPNKDNFLDDLRDQPGDHIALFNKLGIPFKRIKAKEFLKNPELFARSILIVLAHDPKSPYLNQHWVRYIGFSIDENKNYTYYFDWGKSCKGLKIEEFYKYATLGFPEFIYVLGEKETSRMFKFTNCLWLILRFFVIILTNIIGRFI